MLTLEDLKNNGWKSGINQVIQGDCLEGMKMIPDKSIDLILTDPPYGLNNKMKGGSWGVNEKYKEMLVWDELVDENYIQEIFRISKNQIIFGGHLYKLPISRGWLSWEKLERMPTVGDFELAWTSFDKVSKAFRFSRQIPERSHPSQKPVELMRWILANYSKDTDLICDPFMGSWTTARACKDLGRNFLGFELERRYCEVGEKRLAQMNLF